MKKLLMVFMAFVGITSTAFAAPKEYKAPDGFLCARVDVEVDEDDSSKILWTLNGNPYSYATIYFDTGKAEAHSGCDYAEIVNQLPKADDIEQLVLIGSADKQGDNKGYDNTGLAKRRLDYVIDLFEKDGKTILSHSYVAGSESAKIFSLGTDNQEFRSVDIYVIWKLPTCDSNTMTTVSDLQKKLASYNGPERSRLNTAFTKVNDLCKKSGAVLTTSQAEAYQKALADLANVIATIRNENTEVQALVDDSEINGLLIVAYHGLVKQTLDDMGLSVWRTAEGNFNGARLASDSIAGVVLGTAGGLITSHLVKKGQIKNGFEDIQCTIGGQKVADWGDEFTVGIR